MKIRVLGILCGLLFSSFISKSQNIEINPVENVTLSSGTLQRIESFSSKYVQTRPVDIWLPENYSDDKKYAVLYMHDGQMLFDSTTTWNKQEWKVDEWATKLMNEDKTRDFIVVAIWNISDLRHSDYFPNKPFQSLKNKDSIFENAKGHDQHKLFKTVINSDNYLKFIVEEVKPFVDETFSVVTNKENTFIGGSSMGGLISMYAICEYPQVFDGAACISTHWPGIFSYENDSIPQAFFQYVKAQLPDPKTHKLYFDFGTKTLDQYYPKYANQVDSIFLNNGYNETNFKNLKFEGAEHSENSWNQRLDIPFTFLLHK